MTQTATFHPRAAVEEALARGCTSPREISAETQLPEEFVLLILRVLAKQGRVASLDSLSTCAAVGGDIAGADPDAPQKQRKGCAAGSCASCPLTS